MFWNNLHFIVVIGGVDVVDNQVVSLLSRGLALLAEVCTTWVSVHSHPLAPV